MFTRKINCSLKQCRRHNKGLTLAELMLSAAILAFTLTGLLALFVNCLLLNEANRNLSVAVGHAQYAMEEVKNLTFATIASQAWNTADISARGLNPLDTEAIVITVTGVEPKDVLITVTWRDRNIINRTISMETLITEP